MILNFEKLELEVAFSINTVLLETLFRIINKNESTRGGRNKEDTVLDKLLIILGVR